MPQNINLCEIMHWCFVSKTVCFRSETRIICSVKMWSTAKTGKDQYFELWNLTANYIRKKQEGIWKVAWSYWASSFQTSVWCCSSNVSEITLVWGGAGWRSPCCAGCPGWCTADVRLMYGWWDSVGMHWAVQVDVGLQQWSLTFFRTCRNEDGCL